MGRVLFRVLPLALAVVGPLFLGAQETFTVVHSETSALAGAWAAAARSFQESHPGVKVEVRVLDPEEIRQDSEQLLMGGSPPDVLEFAPGTSNTGAVAAEGRFRDLTVEVFRRGWDQLVPAAVRPWLKYDARGRPGTDRWYGVPGVGEFFQVYYNRALFRKAGLGVPRTLAEFGADLEVFRKAGIVPLALGAAGYPCQQLLYELFLAKAGTQEIHDYQTSQGTAAFRSAAWQFAASTLAAWASAKDFGPSPLNLDANGQLAEFEAGNAAMTLLGSGAFGRLQREAPSLDWGTFLFPGNLRHVGAVGGLLTIPVTARHPDWAADFIGLTLRADFQLSLAEAGGLALGADPGQVTNPGARRLIRTFDQLLTGGQLALFPDWPAVGFYDSLLSGGLDLVRGVPADQVLEGLDLAYRTKKRGS